MKLKSDRARAWIVLLVLAGTISCDRVTKEIATARLRNAPAWSLLNDTLRLQYVENAGAFLGLGDSLSPRSRFWVFTMGSGALLLLVAFLLSRKDLPSSDTLGLSLVLAGGLGNLLDRIFLSGRVVDFLNLGFGPVRTGIFNVADVAILLGFAILVLKLPVLRTLQR
jgi:signal peptidase II